MSWSHFATFKKLKNELDESRKTARKNELLVMKNKNRALSAREDLINNQKRLYH